VGIPSAFLVEHEVQSDNSRMIKDIIDVPFPLAASRRLMSFLTFHISIFFSASVPLGALMAMREGCSRALPSKELVQITVLDSGGCEMRLAGVRRGRQTGSGD
jgi:hypothetical protein